MKTLYNIGAVVALLFAAVGLFEWKFPTHDANQYLLYILIGVILSLTVNIFYLYGRIAALEKRGEQPTQLDLSKPLNT